MLTVDTALLNYILIIILGTLWFISITREHNRIKTKLYSVEIRLSKLEVTSGSNNVKKEGTES